MVPLDSYGLYGLIETKEKLYRHLLGKLPGTYLTNLFFIRKICAIKSEPRTDKPVEEFQEVCYIQVVR